MRIVDDVQEDANPTRRDSCLVFGYLRTADRPMLLQTQVETRTSMLFY